MEPKIRLSLFMKGPKQWNEGKSGIERWVPEIIAEAPRRSSIRRMVVHLGRALIQSPGSWLEALFRFFGSLLAAMLLQEEQRRHIPVRLLVRADDGQSLLWPCLAVRSEA